jgi:predicted MFS family arabinose efflux permease
MWPLLAGYWAFGQFWGVWVITITAFNQRHGIDDARYGMYLTVLSVAAVIVMAVGAPRLAALPLRVTVPLGSAALAMGAFLMAGLPTSWLPLAMIVVGAGNGLTDVFANVATQRVETVTGRPALQWLHASYALGGITGAGLAGLLSLLEVDHRVPIVLGGVALLAVAWWDAVRGDPRPGETVSGTRLSVSAFRRHPGLLAAGLVVLFAFLVEGAMDTWAGRYVQETLGVSAAKAAMVFVAFSLSLFLGRMFAGKVLFRLGRRATILLGGAVAAMAGAAIAATENLWMVGAAYLVMGFALSAVAPAGFGLVEHRAHGDQANAIAAVTTLGYAGFVFSPPLVGLVAQGMGLRAAMTLIFSCTAGIVAAGWFAREGPGERSETPEDVRSSR